jgi:hypothetical protein
MPGSVQDFCEIDETVIERLFFLSARFVPENSKFTFIKPEHCSDTYIFSAEKSLFVLVR